MKVRMDDTLNCLQVSSVFTFKLKLVNSISRSFEATHAGQHVHFAKLEREFIDIKVRNALEVREYNSHFKVGHGAGANKVIHVGIYVIILISSQRLCDIQVSFPIVFVFL